MKAINLLPPDLRGAPKGSTTVAADEPGGFGAFAVLGALAICVVALAAYVLTTNTVKDRSAKLEAVGAQARATTERVAQLKPYADFQAMAETRIQTVRDLASSRFDWEQALRDISRAVPADVTLTRLNGSVSTQTGGGSGVRSAIAAPAIELTGCTTGQRAVAALLSRLRNVDGVTRVSLTKSVKPEAPAAGAAGAAAPAQDATGCGVGRPPAFEVVIFFERSEVPATVQDVTVQAGAADATPGAATGTTTGAPAATGTQPASGITTPPADPADQPAGATATPASTPQGTGSR
jgi:Tfp pilus assembly protein PilN